MNHDIFINKKIWSNFTEQERNAYIERVFQHYRNHGFPYFPISDEFRNKELRKLQNYDYRNCIDLSNKTIKQTMHGLSFCWSFHSYHYEIQCNSLKTPFEVFHDDDLFRKVIEKRMRMGDNMSDNGIRKMLKVYSGTQCVSNFRPTAAAAIYHHFSKPNDVVLDMSAGFGGRLLGAFLSNRKYIGIDPSKRAMIGNFMIKEYLQASDLFHLTPNGLDLSSQNLNDKNDNIKLLIQGSEVEFPLPKECIDLCFTSPPYFDCEKYSDEPTQSYLKFPNREHWINNFLRKTFENCYRVLKPSKYMIINIQNVKTFPNLVEEAKRVAYLSNFILEDEWKLALSQLGSKSGYKTEPLLIFRK